MKPGSQATAIDGKLQTKKTKPPTRFTEASLVKELERRGIGRPSTYAAILENIMSREYVKLEKRFLVSTSLGEAVVGHLKGSFAFIDYEFTKRMEENLDAIAEGGLSYKELMASAHDRLKQELHTFQKSTATPCPACGGFNFHHLVKEATKDDSREWNFFGCRDCDATFPNVNGKPGPKLEKKEKKPQVLTEHMCKKCKKPLIRRQGTSKAGKPYDFYGCSGFPKCKQNYETGASVKTLQH